MAGISGNAPRQRKQLSGAAVSLVAVAVSELRGDLARLLDSAWDEPVRRRAEELSAALGQVCQAQGLDELKTLFRATTNLTRLPRPEAVRLLPALREKFESLLSEVQRRLPKGSDGARG